MNRQMLISGISTPAFLYFFVDRMSTDRFGWAVFWFAMAMGHWLMFLNEARKSQRPFWVGFYDGLSLGPVRRLIERLMK